jgi:hypothetical protein
LCPPAGLFFQDSILIILLIIGITFLNLLDTGYFPQHFACVPDGFLFDSVKWPRGEPHGRKFFTAAVRD